MKTDAQLKSYLRYTRALSKAYQVMQTDPESVYHGTLYGYNAGCRCERCRSAQAAYRERLRRLSKIVS